MTIICRVVCDACGEKFAYGDPDEKEDDGWMEVWSGEGKSKDFCSQGCMIDYYNGTEDEDADS